jgi:beta-glucosidase-like glycosyl hydrolase
MAWIQHELYGRLGFKGATITDGLEAGALEAFGNDSTRGLLTSKAGMDILLASARNVTQGESVVDIWWLLWRIGHWIDTL